MVFLAPINIFGAITQLQNVLVAGLAVVVGFLIFRSLLKHSTIGLLVGVVLGALVWLVLKSSLLASVGQTLQGWLGLS